MMGRRRILRALKMGRRAFSTAINLVIAAISLVLCVYIIGAIQPNIKGLTGTANTTVGTIFTQTYNALNLMVVGLIVMAAVALIGLVMRLRG